MPISTTQAGFNPVSTTGGAAPPPFARVWDIAGPWDFTNPSVIDGDFGVFTPGSTTGQAGQRLVLRYMGGVPFEGIAGGGQASMWLPPDVYEGTPRIRSFIQGSESLPSDFLLTNMDFADGVGGSVSLNGLGYCVLFADTAVGSFARLSTLCSPAITGADNVYMTAEILADTTVVGAAALTAGFTQPQATETATQYAFGSRGTNLTLQNWLYTTLYITPALQLPTIRASVATPQWPVIAGGTPCFLQAQSGKSINDLFVTKIDGGTQSTWRRSADTAAALTVFTPQLEVTGLLTQFTSSTVTLQVRNFFVVVF